MITVAKFFLSETKYSTELCKDGTVPGYIRNILSFKLDTVAVE